MNGPARPGWLSRVLGGLPKPVKKDPDLSSVPGPTPLTADRVAGYLRARGYRYVVDDDGDLTGTWDGNRFWFLLLGDHEEILQVRGRWQRALPLEKRTAAALAVNDWNRERIWPKVYLREEDGLLALYSEVSADLECGVTDEQLAQLVACGLGTGVQMFTTFAGLIPGEDVTPPGTPDN